MLAALQRSGIAEQLDDAARTAFLLLALLAGCRQSLAAPQPAAEGEDGQWPMVAKDYQNRRYSGLAEMTSANVANLRVAWTFSTGIPKGHEAAPLVVGNTMYVVTPFPNNAYAFDLRKPGGPPKWTYKPLPAAAAQGCRTFKAHCLRASSADIA